MMTNLNPCPFCGGEAVLWSCRSGYYVKCLACGVVFGDERKEDATGCFEGFDSEGEAVNAWNSLEVA